MQAGLKFRCCRHSTCNTSAASAHVLCHWSCSLHLMCMVMTHWTATAGNVLQQTMARALQVHNLAMYLTLLHMSCYSSLDMHNLVT
jgi:hypothetical protein